MPLMRQFTTNVRNPSLPNGGRRQANGADGALLPRAHFLGFPLFTASAISSVPRYRNISPFVIASVRRLSCP